MTLIKKVQIKRAITYEIVKIVFDVKIFFSRSNGSYALAVYLVFPNNAPAPGIIDSAVNGYTDQSANVTDTVKSQFSTFSTQIPDPQVLKENQVTLGKLIILLQKDEIIHSQGHFVFRKMNP